MQLVKGGECIWRLGEKKPNTKSTAVCVGEEKNPDTAPTAICVG